MRGDHHPQSLIFAHAEFRLQDRDDELPRREVVIHQNDLMKTRALDLAMSSLVSELVMTSLHQRDLLTRSNARLRANLGDYAREGKKACFPNVDPPAHDVDQAAIGRAWHCAPSGSASPVSVSAIERNTHTNDLRPILFVRIGPTSTRDLKQGRPVRVCLSFRLLAAGDIARMAWSIIRAARAAAPRGPRFPPVPPPSEL